MDRKFLAFILIISFLLFLQVSAKGGKKIEVYGKVISVSVNNNYINIESSDEHIAILLKDSTKIKYGNKTLYINDINEGDVIKATGFYMDNSVMADKIEILSRNASSFKAIIYSISHNGDRTLKAGDVLTVTMSATPGGKAYFDIKNLVMGVAMKEISSGKYEGKYTVLSGDRADNASVVGHILLSNGSEAGVEASSNVTIGFSSLKLTQLLPSENSSLDNNKPNILMIIDSNKNKAIIPQTVTLKVNGVNVTQNTSITDYVISYLPSKSLPSGLNKVSFSAIDVNGREVKKDWSFYVTSDEGSDIIYSVIHNGKKSFQPGDKLIVTMKGISGGYGTFDIGNFKKGIGMKESQSKPGTYKGEYTVAKSDSLKDIYIICYLKIPGQKASFTAENPVSFNQSDGLCEPFITSPKNDSKITVPFTVKGKSNPGYTVEITVDYTISLFNVIGIQGDSVTKEAVADSSGNFEATFSNIISKEGTTYTIKAVTVSPGGERSRETVIKVVQK